jgi:phospholipase C
MAKITRRNFLKAAGAGAALSMLPASIQRALAIPANSTTGTIADVKHVVLIMQENRAFDHYYGTMPGVRGYSDRFPIPTPNGNVWTQTGVGGELIQPYYLDPSDASPQSNGYYIGGDHTWQTMHAAWDQGIMNAWPQAKSLNATMGYLEQSDLPYYRALAGAFTICDAYHCSVLGPTYPNRLHWQSGTNGAALGQGAVIYTEDCWELNNPVDNGLTWPTFAEQLQAAGISWKVYSYDSTSGTGANLNCAFQTFRQANVTLSAQGVPASTPYYTPASSGPADTAQTYTEAQIDALSPLYKGYGNTMPTGSGVPMNNNGISGTTADAAGPFYLQDMLTDVTNNALPQVSWIVAPSTYQEHPLDSIAPQGEWYIEQVINTLTSNPEVWAQTVLLINYDENDAFFDHMPPPAPPSPKGGAAATEYYGNSTVSTAGEYLTMGPFPGDTTPFVPDGNCVGLGMRVPMLVVSPWTVGGYVNSQVFDHTSTLQFIGKVFGSTPQNISAWRQAVVGDMTSCFNFANPNDTVPTLPTPSSAAAASSVLALQKEGSTPTAPAAGSTALPTQPLALVPSKALPYALHTSAIASPSNGAVELEFSNTGTQAAVFHVYDQLNLTTPPRRYTVEAGKMLTDTWNVTANTPAGQYSLWVLGPAGFHREFNGNVSSVTSGANPEVKVCYDHTNDAVYLTITNTGTQTANVTVTANAYRTDGPWTYTVAPGAQTEPSWSLTNSYSWYDFTLATTDGTFTRRFAGRVETGQDGYCDPAMGVAVTAPASTAPA